MVNSIMIVDRIYKREATMRSDKSQSDIRHFFAVSNIDKRSLTAHSEQKSSNIKI
ncbi:hypothetical protein PKHYL_41040 [Psychrobacter sp. KH172YL61]|nr:hypothetical protein PKHYL_41040 [Psychrobacter sp. KH172YL61]